MTGTMEDKISIPAFDIETGTEKHHPYPPIHPPYTTTTPIQQL